MSTNAIEISGLVKRFRSTVALDDLTMSVPTGQVHNYLGPNGAGKVDRLFHPVQQKPRATPEQFVVAVRSGPPNQTLPMLEVFTEFTTRKMLYDYLDFDADPPATDGLPGQGDPTA